jgi:hypothetical protein
MLQMAPRQSAAATPHIFIQRFVLVILVLLGLRDSSVVYYVTSRRQTAMPLRRWRPKGSLHAKRENPNK